MQTSAAGWDFSIVQPETVLAQSPNDFSHLRQPYAATNKSTTRPLRHTSPQFKTLLRPILHIIHPICHATTSLIILLLYLSTSPLPTQPWRQLPLTAPLCGQTLSPSSPTSMSTILRASDPTGITTSRMAPERLSTASCSTSSTPSSNLPRTLPPMRPPILSRHQLRSGGS